MGTAAKKSFHLPESSKHYPPRMDYRTAHTRIELRLDFQKQRMSGACTLEIVPIRGGLSEARFDACEMDITGVTVDGTEARFEHDNHELVVQLSPGRSKYSVRVEYSAAPRAGVHFTAPDEGYPDKEVQAWTHNEAEFARYWYPCQDHPADRSSTELLLTVPKEFRVISNGKLLSRREDGESATFHWREDLPHSSYLTSFVAGRFGEVTQEADGVKLHYNFPESKREDVLRYFGETPRMIQVFGELTGVKYPYEKYDQTTVQDFIFGGMENFNATTLAMSYYPDAGSEEDFQTSYSTPHVNAVDLVAHELAHQWFGDLVTCSDWAHAWLHESFATYLQVLYVEKTRGVDEMRWDLDARTEGYFEEDANEYRRAIVDSDYVWADDIFDAHLYPKGGNMLHELRYIMGDEAFFKGLSHYLKTYSYSNADTHDFVKSMVRVSGLALEEFIEQAFRRPGHPEFEVSYSWDSGSRAATLRVRQVQKTDDGTPVFKLPCEVVFYVNGERVGYRVQLDSVEQTLTFPLAAQPTVVEFDPQRWLLKELKFDKSVELLLNQLEESEDAWSRAEAARALGRLRSNRAVEGLRAAAVKQQFWHVRESALKALGEIGTDEALRALLGLGLPKERRVRRGVAAALGNFKAEDAKKVLIGLLRSDESPYVRCEAALALAKAWPEGALPHLKEAMKARTPNDTLAEACLDAMGKLKDDEVKAIVAEGVAYGKPPRVRIGALKAIKGRGYILDDEVPLLRELILHEKEFRIRLQVVNELVRPLGDRRFMDTVLEASRTDPDLRVRRKALETLHELAASAAVSTSIANLKAEVERLKGENASIARAQG
jgi:aminopeptidase N